MLVALLDALRIEKAIVDGISAGGWTAIELAAHFPERVSKLILGSAVTKDWLDRRGQMYRGAKVIFSPMLEWLMWWIIRLLCSLAPKMIANGFLPSFSTMRGFVNDIDQSITAETLQKVVCPTLILHSTNDNSVPMDHALHAKNQIKGSVLVTIDNLWGHMIWIGDEFETAKESVRSFLGNG